MDNIVVPCFFWLTVYICFYNIQWKRIRAIPFILKSHNNTAQQIKMHILNQAQGNLIYNTNRNLYLWIEIFISTTDLYNATADRWPCHLPNRNKQFTYFQWGSIPLRSDINGTELPPANILIPLERQLIALQLCSRLFVLYCRNCPKDGKFRHMIPILRKLGAA